MGMPISAYGDSSATSCVTIASKTKKYNVMNNKAMKGHAALGHNDRIFLNSKLGKSVACKLSNESETCI